MKQDITWGIAAALAIAAAVGISTRSIRTPGEGSARSDVAVKAGRPSLLKAKEKPGRACSDAEKLLQEFLLTRNDSIAAPGACYDNGVEPASNASSTLRAQASNLKFVIATLPDPLHTHFSLLFDRNAEAIQQAAQDAGYVYDSSWLPWETEEDPLITLADEDEAGDRKDAREEQPGIIVFRKAIPLKERDQQPFQKGLVVFVVGEEATRGIHRRQFQNAAAWISSLQKATGKPASVAILGPSFSGSFPSLRELLADPEVHTSFSYLPFDKSPETQQLRIYSGSVTEQSAAEWFGDVSSDDPELKGWRISFHSFQNGDDVSLNQYCEYLDKTGIDPTRVAILSEDETAYGFSGITSDASTSKDDPTSKEKDDDDKEQDKDHKLGEKVPCSKAVRLYYPRDISALRAAYQTQSIFSSSSSSSQPSPDAQRRNLPSDLADPSGEAHDTIRSYGGNQTPLSQEAVLMGIVSELRAHRAQYVVLRSSNTLDPLFLTKFLRGTYSAARVVILGSDLLFQRERGSSGISGVLQLSTYPLFAWEQDWTNWPRANYEHSHRVFTEDLVEGTYIAARFLLHDAPVLGDNLDSTPKCSSQTDDAKARCFLPINPSAKDFPLPDYAAPFWTVPQDCKEVVVKGGPLTPLCASYLRPSIWISVLGRGDFYPLAAFHDNPFHDDVKDPEILAAIQKNASHRAAQAPKPSDDGPRPSGMPLGMKLCLIAILAGALFHATCCLKASFTAKPAFRAHFATTRDPHLSGPWRQPTLIVIGSALIMFMAVVSAWGCGAFSPVGGLLARAWFLPCFLLLASGGAIGSILANNRAIWRLERDKINDESHAGGSAVRELHACLRWVQKRISWSSLALVLAVAAFYVSFVRVLESVLKVENRIPTYWRSMNLSSGVSPIIPFLWLFAGLYAWFWYSLHGLALFGIDRPRLPSMLNLKLRELPGIDPYVLRMFSQEQAADSTERTAMPLAPGTMLVALILFVVFGISAVVLSPRVPIRSLGHSHYAYIFCVWLDLCFSLLLAEALQLLRTWTELRQLLVFLDRMPIRRTLGALRGFSWGSVWKMSGNVLDVRYKLLSRQLESLNHVRASFDDLIFDDHVLDDHVLDDHAKDPGREDEALAAQACLPVMNEAQSARNQFAGWYARKYRDPNAGNFKTLEVFQEKIAAVAGKLLTDILAPAWRKETDSLVLAVSTAADDAPSTPDKVPTGQVEEHIRNAEELVSLPYLGFVQNILGRMRTLVLGMAWLFVAVTLSVASYPFDPRPAVSGVLIALFVALAALISFVYADMHRDATLSHVTKTNPGELGTQFWFKLIGFGAGPILGLLATVFPGLSDFFFSWLQPGLATLK